MFSPGSPFSALAAHSLAPPSSSLTSLLSLPTSEHPSCLFRQGQCPKYLCTHPSALHRSGADTAPTCGGASRTEQMMCPAPSAFPPFCLSLQPKPDQIRNEFLDTIPTLQHPNPVKSSLSLCLSHLCCLLGCILKAFLHLLVPPEATPVPGEPSWGLGASWGQLWAGSRWHLLVLQAGCGLFSPGYFPCWTWCLGRTISLRPHPEIPRLHF